MIKDVLVTVNGFVFPLDFYILYMHDINSFFNLSVLLGRPFLKTTKALIDVDKEPILIEHERKIERFEISKTLVIIYHFCFSASFFQDSGQPKKLGVKDGVAAINSDYE